MDISYHSLDVMHWDVIHKAFMDAFSDYQVDIDPGIDPFLRMMKTRSVDLSLSLGAFKGQWKEGDLIGFILNGYRKKGSQHVAYDSGTGICRSFQGKGIAKILLDRTIRLLRTRGITTYVLEVITTNGPALKLYEGRGFHIKRRLSCFTAGKRQLGTLAGIPDLLFSTPDISMLPFDRFRTWWNFEPTWQNQTESVLSGQDQLTAVVTEKAGAIIGYGIISKHRGDILQIAVDPAFRNQGIGSAILNRLTACTVSETILALNIEANDPKTIGFFLKNGFTSHVGQYEMVLSL